MPLGAKYVIFNIFCLIELDYVTGIIFVYVYVQFSLIKTISF